MSVFGSVFGFRGSSSSGIQELFTFPVKRDDFIFIDMVTTFTKILNDTVERTTGLKSDQMNSLSDSCVGSEASKGLVTLLAEAMTRRKEIAITYKQGVIRLADKEELDQIKADYKKSAKSELGVLVSFENYNRSKMLEVYSAMELAALSSLNKTMNVAKATQLKIEGLRKSVGLVDSTGAKDQATELANALRRGEDIMIDAGDSIENAAPDVSPTKTSIEFLDAKRGYLLGFPAAYINGTMSGGIGSTGEADTREIERGLKQYFTSIIRPVCKELFKAEVTWKTQDFKELATGMEVAKGLSLVDDALISPEQKKKIAEKALSVESEQK